MLNLGMIFPKIVKRSDQDSQSVLKIYISWDNGPILLKVSDQIHVKIILCVDLGFKSVRIQFIC